jgi:hypothetical protein
MFRQMPFLSLSFHRAALIRLKMKSAFIAIALMGSSSAAIAPLAEPCEPLKHSVAPEPVPNTAESFKTYPFYSDISKVIATPKGYQAATIDGDAAVRSPKYMHYVELDTYDATACAQHCDSSRGCKSCMYHQRSLSYRINY